MTDEVGHQPFFATPSLTRLYDDRDLVDPLESEEFSLNSGNLDQIAEDLDPIVFAARK